MIVVACQLEPNATDLYVATFVQIAYRNAWLKPPFGQLTDDVLFFLSILLFNF